MLDVTYRSAVYSALKTASEWEAIIILFIDVITLVQRKLQVYIPMVFNVRTQLSI